MATCFQKQRHTCLWVVAGIAVNDLQYGIQPGALFLEEISQVFLILENPPFIYFLVTSFITQDHLKGYVHTSNLR